MSQSLTKNELYLLVANCINNVVWLRQTHISVEGRLSSGHAIRVTATKDKVAISVWQPCNSVTKNIAYDTIFLNSTKNTLTSLVNNLVLDVASELLHIGLTEKPIKTPLVEFNEDYEGSM